MCELPVHSDTISVTPAAHASIEVKVIYLVRGKSAAPFDYIQSSRNGTLATLGDPEQTYAAANFYGMLSWRAHTLSDYIKTLEVDAVLRVPSRFPKQAQFLEQSARLARVNITDRLTKTGQARAGEAASAAQLHGELEYRATGDENTFKSILIVDDSTYKQSSVCAVISRLLAGGVSPRTSFTLACYFWSEGGGQAVP